MMKLYTTANLNLFDNGFLNSTDFASHEDRNAYMIEHWNSVIRPDDKVLILGNISPSKEKEKIKITLDKMNGHKYLLYSVKDANLSRDEWTQCGIDLTFCCTLSNTDSKNRKIVLTTEALHNPKKDEVQMLTTDQTYYGSELCRDNNPSVSLFCQGTTQFFKKAYVDRVLNVDINRWDYTPLLCDTLFDIYLQMVQFA